MVVIMIPIDNVHAGDNLTGDYQSLYNGFVISLTRSQARSFVKSHPSLVDTNDITITQVITYVINIIPYLITHIVINKTATSVSSYILLIVLQWVYDHWIIYKYRYKRGVHKRQYMYYDIYTKCKITST